MPSHPALASLLAPAGGAAPAARSAAAAAVVARQADGHGSVRFRRSPAERTLCLIPDGDELSVLGQERGLLRVAWRGRTGYVKPRNVAARAPAAAAPPRAAAPAGGGVLTLTVNGKAYTVDTATDASVTPRTTLNEFLRARVGTGTRRSCGEGGCGACVVMLTPAAGGRGVACNSCIRPLLSCHGAAVVTTEGIGSAAQGYHPVQSRLAEHCGSQCGFCSTGFVMTMYSFLQGTAAPTRADIESVLDGNICRCTGYRPILDAFKSFAAGGHGEAAARGAARPAASPPLAAAPLVAAGEGATWADAVSEADLQAKLRAAAAATPPAADLMLVAGHTSSGIYKARRPDAMIHIGGIASLGGAATTADGVEVGALLTLNDTIAFFEATAAGGGARAAHLAHVAAHLRRVAGHPVRSTATIGGNVMFAHMIGSPFFPSDCATLLLGLGATLEVVDSSGAAAALDVAAFLAADMKYKYLRKIAVPYLAAGEVFRCFKAQARSRFAKAWVIAAMSAVVSADGTVRAGSARVAYGGCSPKPTRLASVEKLLDSASVTDQGLFAKTLCPAVTAAVSPTLNPAYVPHADYRKSVAVALFYKFFLALQPALPAPLRSAAAAFLPRGVTASSQSYDTDPATAPVGAAIPKLEGAAQCGGEARYAGDEPVAGLLHAAVVLAAQVGAVASVDTAAAAALPGFVKWVAHSDAASNALPAPRDPLLRSAAGGALFAAGGTTYLGQYVGVVVADTARHATACAAAVKVAYASTSPAVVTIADAVKQGRFAGAARTVARKGDAAAALSASAAVVAGEFAMGEQYQFHLETQTAVVVPGKTVMVYSATQKPPAVKAGVAAALGIDAAKVTVQVGEVGGGYGGKVVNSVAPAAAAAVAAQAVGAPVKLVLELEDNMLSAGKRPPYQFGYQIGFERDGTINAVKATCYSGGAFDISQGEVDNCYGIENWDVTTQDCKLDIPTPSFMRAPSQLGSSYFIEWAVTRVAAELGVASDVVREKNFYKKGDTTLAGMQLKYWNMNSIWSQLKASSDYAARLAAAQAFNAANRWTKKGMALVPARYTLILRSGPNCNISVNEDGSVEVRHGGSEIGQGINTKVAQAAAYELGVAMGRVAVLPTTTAVTAGVTGGSTTSEYCCLAAINASRAINAALAPARKLLPGGSWEDTVAKAYELGITLNEMGKSDASGSYANYNSYSAAAVEVTLDVLTGEVGIDRTDLLFDCGRSLNPAIDVGQVEGAFVMGCGLALQEEQLRDTSGALENRNTWGYKVPTAFDIPREWNVTLLKDAPNPTGILSSKASGEPPILLSFAVLDAVSSAVSAARADSGAGRFVAAAAPCTVAERHLACATAPEQFTFA